MTITTKEASWVGGVDSHQPYEHTNYTQMLLSSFIFFEIWGSICAKVTFEKDSNELVGMRECYLGYPKKNVIYLRRLFLRPN